MAAERSPSHFVKGAAILGLAGLISKLLGAVYRIPYQNIAGDIGLYVYMQVYPLYTTLLTLATAGFPIAISKIVSERLALGDAIGAKKAFQVASLVLCLLGLLFFSLLYIGAPTVSRLMGDEQLTMPLRAVAWSLPLVPVVAIMRGYFQGHQYMVPTGASQVVEQLVRVVVILVSAYWFMTVYQDAYLAGTGAVFAALPGALAAIVVLLFYWQRNARIQRKFVKKQREKQRESTFTNREILRSLLYYALPICLGALVLPLIPLVDSLTVVNMLEWGGVSENASKVLKGVFDRGQPLIQFGTFFATSLSLALVPAISEAAAQKQRRVIAARTEIALRLTLLLGLPASVGLVLLAKPINVMLYGDDSGTQALAIQSLTVVFATLAITTSGILQGLGKVMLPACHYFAGVLLKLVLNLLLVPFFGISGAACATVSAYVAAMLLNMIAIVRYTGVEVKIRQFLVRPIVAVLVMAVAVLAAEAGMFAVSSRSIASERLVYTISGLFGVAVGGIVYGFALLRTGALSRSDMRFLPKGERVAALLTRWKLLRDE